MVKNMLSSDRILLVYIKIHFFEGILMKNLSLIALAILMGLPGCCCKKEKPARDMREDYVEQNIDMFSSEMANLFDSNDLDDEDGDDLQTFFDFDSETGEFIVSEDDHFADEDDSLVYSWVDHADGDSDLKPVYFAFNHYGLNEAQRQVLAEDVAQLKDLLADAGQDANPVVVVEGHTCQEGERAYNQSLSEKRAKYVADLLVREGISQDAIKVVGRGQEEPVILDGRVLDGSREDRAPNRRVEFRVIYTA
jgi:outer membrane protein OmpA-like peptidoglycan-associated protein